MAEKISRKLQSTITRPKTKKRGIFSSTSKGDHLPATTHLMFPKDIKLQSPYSRTLNFKTEDKLSIFIRHKNYCVVQRKHDRTVAVLKNAVFKERNPPAMFDCEEIEEKIGATLSGNIRVGLMYTVAKQSFSDPTGIVFETGDVIFTVAACCKKLLGINPSYKVGVFPSDFVFAITKPRQCFYEGMMLDVTAIANFEAESPKELSFRRGVECKIRKGKKGLFDWHGQDDLKVPLNFIAEKGIDVSAIMTEDEGIYDTVSDIKQPLPPEVHALYDKHVPELNSDEDDAYETPRSRYEETMSRPNQSPTGDIESRKHSEENKKIETQFRERLALGSTKEGSNGPLPPLPRSNSLYMDANTSPIESARYVTTPTRCSEFSENPRYVATPTIDSEESPRYVATPTRDSEKSTGNADTATNDYETVDQERPHYDRLVHSWKTSGAVTKNAEDKIQCNTDIPDILNKLDRYRDVMVSEQLRGIVSQYVDEDVWNQLGRRLKVPKNKRREIEDNEGNIYAKTNELLSAWCERLGTNATVGFLLDALVEVNPEDLDLILEDIWKALHNNVASGGH